MSGGPIETIGTGGKNHKDFLREHLGLCELDTIDVETIEWNALSPLDSRTFDQSTEGK